MTREQTIKAGIDYGKRYESRQTLDIGTERMLSFICDAKWRIESVWHDAEEQPENGRLLLCQSSIYPTNIAGPNNDDFRDTAKEYNVTRWAYIDDLLPEDE